MSDDPAQPDADAAAERPSAGPVDPAAARRQRAQAAIEAIARGADPGATALTLSNAFTDSLTRRLRRRPEGEGPRG